MSTSALETAVAAATSAAATAMATAAADNDATPPCPAGNEYNGDIGLRVSAIFVILVGSVFGAVFPVWARGNPHVQVPSWAFFIAKYFGSGVIIATAFIHLLAPANEALTNECLTGPIVDYPWVEGIALMTVFALCFVEIMAMRFAIFDPTVDHDDRSTYGHSHSISAAGKQDPDVERSAPYSDDPVEDDKARAARRASLARAEHPPGEDHLSPSRAPADTDSEHGVPAPDVIDPTAATHPSAENKSATLQPPALSPINTTPHSPTSPSASASKTPVAAESYSAQLTAIFILEFGVIFHSIFIGLTLAVAGDEFRTLYAVLVFHQTFEGLGLGSRLAIVPWPKRWNATKGTKQSPWTPYFLALGYAFSTPIALGIGLGVRESYVPEGQTTLVVQGVFDSISAGILIYTGLVELMAHEFMFSGVMRRKSLGVVLAAFGTMCVGAGLMALLGKWA